MNLRKYIYPPLLLNIFYSLLLLLIVTSCQPRVEQIEIRGGTMGTTYSLKANARQADETELRSMAEAVFKRINAQMSTWRPDSEISRFNRQQTTDWFEISSDFKLVLDTSQKINQQTGGAFDISVGGLVELWGFGSSVSPGAVPQPETISSQLQHTGPDTFELDSTANRIRKTDPKVQLDLSGIAKGYAVDTVAEIVSRAGVEDFLVEIGGEIRASGKRPDGLPWSVAIERPDSQGQSVHTTLSLANAAIATSGDYRAFFKIGNKRYSHIIDPDTGRPPDNQVASVSVVASDTMSADALATGLMVMGVEKALSLAEQLNLAVMIIERRGKEFTVLTSTRFAQLQLADSR